MTTPMFALPWLLAAFAGGYLLGSIPFGLLLTRLAGLGDVRKIGSGNIGATNVLRTGRKDIAAATLLLDALKGTAAVLIAAQWGPQMAVWAALGAFLGHLYPVWLGFKGGKGVATFVGIIFGLHWPAGLVFCAVWLAVAFLFRMSSLAALYASAAVPLAMWAMDEFLWARTAAILALIIWFAHRENIARIWAGTESRIGAKA